MRTTKRRKPGTGRGSVHHFYVATPWRRAFLLRRWRWWSRMRTDLRPSIIDLRSTVEIAVAA